MAAEALDSLRVPARQVGQVPCTQAVSRIEVTVPLTRAEFDRGVEHWSEVGWPRDFHLSFYEEMDAASLHGVFDDMEPPTFRASFAARGERPVRPASAWHASVVADVLQVAHHELGGAAAAGLRDGARLRVHRPAT
jgi:hypothetical protein